MQIFSLLLNLLIFVLTFLTLWRMISGSAHDKVLSGKGFRAFKYFTVQSNIFMGIAALIYALLLIPALSGKESLLSTERGRQKDHPA